MSSHTNSTNSEVVPKRARFVKQQKRWFNSEKRIVLSVLKKYGHNDIEKFAKALPTKTRYQIVRYLNQFKRIAARKLKKKHCNTQHKLSKVHQWLPLINSQFDTEPALYRNLPTLVLPIFEEYAQHSNPKNVGNVDFSAAYKFLFNSMNNLPMNEDMSNETMAMLLASYDQILEEIRSDKDEVNDALKNSISRTLNQMNSQSLEKRNKSCSENVLKLPEVNTFFWTEEEMKVLCQKKK